MTEAPALHPPATAAPPGPLADLILVRLLPATKTRPPTKKIAADLAPFFHRPPTPDAITAATDQLRAAGLMTSLGQHLSDAGRERALSYLGVNTLPAKASWTAVKAKLVPKALGLPADAADTADKLAAVLLKRQLGLPVGTGHTLTAVFDALAARELGFPDAAKIDLRAALVSKLIEEQRPLTVKQLKTAVPARLLEAHGTADLRKLALKGFADADRAPVAADETFDLTDFANTVLSVARTSPTGRFGTNKVFISHVWRQLRDEPRFKRLGTDGFKAKLVEANRADLLTLSRADLVQVMDPADVRESEIVYLNATFHFILIGKE